MGATHRLFVSCGMISAFVLSMIYYWFAIADRYAIFLYGHTTVNVPTAQPFDEITRSRYWMAGLVAAAAVMVGYGLVNWVLGISGSRRGRTYVPAPWRRVWMLCALPLAVGIPAITMTVNTPVLPFNLAAACVLATLGGLAVALPAATWAGQRPRDLVWLGLDGLGLMPTLMMLRAVELPGRGLSLSPALAWTLAAVAVLGGAFWLAAMTWLRRRRRVGYPRAGELFVAGIAISYVLLPLVHYLFATPPDYRYITTASNFFAYSWLVQIGALALAAVLAWGVTRLRTAARVDPPAPCAP